MKKKFIYRPEIDGLRALAIMPVVLFHADFQNFNGGYVGVDIFFVISGYLIMSLILKEIENKEFSLINFYERRARRILPVLFLIILLCMPFAWIILLPADLELFIETAVASITFWSNYVFYFEIDYFETTSELKPLLHTWSLSIEEQFYIFFPLLFIFSKKILNKKYFYLILIISTLSLFLAQWGGNLKFSYPYIEKNFIFFNQSKITNFFLPWGRIWELGLGVIIAFILFKKRQIYFYNNFFCLIGLALIIFSILTFKANTNHPGFLTLIPTAGTALLILFMNSKTYLHKIFSQKIFVFIGLISYSVYLFHYPIFTFIEYSDNLIINSYNKILIIVIIFFISFISWKYFEKPFRNKKKIKIKNFLLLLGIFYIFFFILYFIIINNNGFKNRFDKNFDQFSINFNVKDLEEETSLYKKELRIEKNFTNKNKIKVLIIGNSVAIDLLMAIDQNKDLFDNYEFREYYFKPEYLFQNNDISKEKIKNLITSQSFIDADVIMLSTLYTEYEIKFQKQNIIFLLNELVKKNNKLLVITGHNPVFVNNKGINPLFSILLKNKNLELTYLDLDKKYFKKLSKKFERFSNDIKIFSDKLNLIYLNKYDYSCNINGKSCKSVTSEGNLIYFDGIHYTIEGAKYFGKKIYEIGWLRPIDNYFKNYKY